MQIPPTNPHGTPLPGKKIEDKEKEKQEGKHFELPKERQKPPEQPKTSILHHDTPKKEIKHAKEGLGAHKKEEKKPQHTPVGSKEGRQEKEDQNKHEDKKTGDLTAQGQTTNQPTIQSESDAPQGAKNAPELPAATQMQQIAKLIHNTVSNMRLGQVGETHFTSLDLKQTADLPPAFIGSNLTITQSQAGIVIHFDNFMTPQQQNAAIALVEKNKEELQELIKTLSAKNIQVTELAIGGTTIPLPRSDLLPRPFEVTQGQPSESAAERRQEERDQGQQQDNQEGDE